MKWRVLVGVGIILFLFGCVASNPQEATASDLSSSSGETIIDQGPDLFAGFVNTPGDPFVICTTGTPAENRDCFETALMDCSHSAGVFWKTLDGASLTFETVGLDETNACKVRVTVNTDVPSSFDGKSATCLLSLHDGIYVLEDLDLSSCTGTYSDTIQKS